MKSLNRVQLIGHVGGDPELLISKNGKSYTRLRVATNRTWKDEEEKRQKRTDWHSVFVFGSLAEQCAAHLKKGSLIYVEGALNQWDSEGSSQAKQSINAQTVQFLSWPRSKDSTLSDGHLDNFAGTRNHDAVAHLG